MVDRSSWEKVAQEVVSVGMEVPHSFNTPWLVSWAVKDGAICHFNFTFPNLVVIGTKDDACQTCKGVPDHPGQTEFLVKAKLTQIMVQKHRSANGIQAVLIKDSTGHVTSMNWVDAETISDINGWKVFELEDGQHLLDMARTGDFEQIQFVAGTLPEFRCIQ